MMRLLLKYGPSVLLVLAIAFGGWKLRDLIADKAALEIERADLQEKIALRDAQLVQAARIRKLDGEYRAEVEAARIAWEALRNDQQNVEGADDPLDSFLRAGAERLWP